MPFIELPEVLTTFEPNFVRWATELALSTRLIARPLDLLAVVTKLEWVGSKPV